MKIMRILTSLAIAAFLFAGSAFRCLAAEPEPEYSISIACSSTEYTAIGTNTVINFNYAAQLAFKIMWRLPPMGGLQSIFTPTVRLEMRRKFFCSVCRG